MVEDSTAQMAPRRPPIRPRGERNRPVVVGPATHGRLKAEAALRGMKVGALAERLIQAGFDAWSLQSENRNNS
jgi:hypothetical protein